MWCTPAALLKFARTIFQRILLAPITHNRLHVFPRYAPVLWFPALYVRYMFYRTRQPLHVFPRLASIPCFSALNIAWVFYRLTDTHFSRASTGHYWFITLYVDVLVCSFNFTFSRLVTNLVTCLAVHIGPYPLGSWSPLSTIRWQSRYLNDSSASLASGPTPSRRPSTA